MGWIKEIIKDEKRAHALMPFGEEKRDSDWAQLAEDKIIKQLEGDGVLKPEFCSKA